jgi:hypothetical protein
MPTLAELASERRAKLKEFSNDIYDQSATFDVSQLNDWIAEASVTSKEDAFAALDIIIEQIASDQSLAIAMATALRNFLDEKIEP